MIIPCVHTGKKTKLSITYLGKKREVFACAECEKVIRSASICEVLS